ncbi:hypothetical protein Nepgr_013208 [Nepenthes gracilis]|uniref:Pentatricopeptide repeat-containing protein n=1 Tax=Nepenthes gracilis TaxID=150966 RepID=A0AAD3XNG3_NEPGR|nr:hypothetical protein Nepgr_013208 [Nepenthes gracilis]
MKSRWIFHKLNSQFPSSVLSVFSTFRTHASSMNGTKFAPSRVDVSLLLSTCGREGNLYLGSALHASIIKKHEFYDPRFCDDPRNAIVVWNSLLGMYWKCQELSYAVKVFDEMPMRDTVSWNSIISGFLTHGEFDMGMRLFRKMRELRANGHDQATLTSILSASDGSGFLSSSKMIHALAIMSGYAGDITVGNALITSYCKCGFSDLAKHVFDEMNERNVVTWTAVISGLVQNYRYEDSLNLFMKMRRILINPNALTYLGLLSACAGLQALRGGRQIHGLLWKVGFHLDLCIESALMDMYSKCGCVEDALQIFHSADNLDDVSVTVILVGFAQNGFKEDAIQIFVKLVKTGIDIDPDMVSAVLGVFGVDTSVALGQQIHSLIIKKSFSYNPFVSNGLINMYSKCGNLEESNKIFHRMPERNSVSWNSIIAAFARHGDGLKALKMYEEMILEGIKPTDVTFLSLLHACSHVGLVEKGMEFLESMSKVHGLTPRMEHYACVVDMLGRSSLLNEAKSFIEKLPVKPGIMVWQALLGACSIHGDSEMGKFAAEQLFVAAPESPAPYVILANIYSSERRWRDRAMTFKRMKEIGVAKETGISWIEIEKKVHSFVVWDKMHPKAEIIYSVLADLIGNMRDEGYKPDKRFILCYMEDDEE